MLINDKSINVARNENYFIDTIHINYNQNVYQKLICFMVFWLFSAKKFGQPRSNVCGLILVWTKDIVSMD